MADESSANIEFDPPVSATLLRRLAEGADGFRNKGPAVYVLTKNPDGNGHHEMQGPFRRGQIPPGLQSRIDRGECIAVGLLDSIDEAANADAIGQIEIAHTPRRGGQGIVKIKAGTTDTAFYSLPSVEKFAIPYYSRLYGPAYAAELRKRYLHDSLQVMVHLPGTEYQNPAAALAPSDQPGLGGIVLPGLRFDGFSVIEPVVP